jgi:hypothetical protein
LISSSDAGFSKAEVSPSFHRRTRRARRGASLLRFAFWYVADEQNFLGSERFARLDGERVF